jgi:acetolactate synthase-1/2/3 large subunit
MESADLVIALGCRLAIQLVGHNFDAFSPDASVVMVDLDEAELKKPGVKIDLPIHRDAKQFLQRLIEKLKGQTLPDWDGWAGYCRDLESQNPMVTPAQKKDPIDLYYFMSRLDALSDGHHVFVTDAGSNYYAGGQVYKFEHGQREITSGAFASMGLSIPLAIGAGVADRKTQVLAVTGDGSLELNLQELKTMSHYDLDIKLFVINNGGYVSMRNWQDGFFDGRRIETAEATGIGTLDMSRIADAFDLRFQRISSHKEIDQKIKQVLSDRSPTFIEVVCDDQQRIIEPIKDLSYNVSQLTPDPGSDTI